MTVLTSSGPGESVAQVAGSYRERIRMLLVTDMPILRPGGSERFLCNLLGGLDPTRFRIDVIQLCDPPGGDFRPPPSGSHIRLEYWPIDAVYGRRALRAFLTLRRRLLAERYHIVQSQHEKSDILCALLPRTPDCRLRISNRRDTGFQKNGLVRNGFRMLNHRFDRVIAPSRAILDGLVRDERVCRERTHCLPNGVDTVRFAPIDGPGRSAQRARFGLPPHAFLFGCVARLREVKCHRDLLDGFALAAGDRPDVQLVLVGDGELEADLRAQAARLGIADRVLFLGPRADVERLLPLFDAFVLTSRTEGMSNAVLEAMACGLPVIATAVGGNPETIDAPNSGLLVPPHAPQQLAKAMQALLDDPVRTRRMGRQARQRAIATFSIDAMVRSFSRLYQEVCPA
jgi:L-malate glycosyltransferase